MIENWAGLVSRIFNLPNHYHIGVEVSPVSLCRVSSVSVDEEAYLARISKKLVDAQREFAPGKNKYCSHADCGVSRKILEIHAYAILPEYDCPGIEVRFRDCDHRRVYTVVDEELPKRVTVDPYASAGVDPHRLKGIILKILEKRKAC